MEAIKEPTKKEIRKQLKKERERQIKELKLQYTYFGDRYTQGAPVYSVGYTIDDAGQLKCAVILLSPKEVFSKSEAHKRLKGRYVKGEKVTSFNIPGVKPKYEEVASLIKGHLISEMSTKNQVAGIKKPYWFTEDIQNQIFGAEK